MQTRIAGYDFARSLALFGLIAETFSRNIGHTDFPFVTLPQGGGSTTFLVLGGIGLSLLRQRDQRTNPARRSADSPRRLIKRAASLLVVGICCYLIWGTYFLCYYSICIAVGALLLTASNRWLWSLAIIFVLIAIALPFWVFSDGDAIDNFETLQASDPWTVEGIAFRLFLYGFDSIFFWTGLLLIGMWLGRRKVHCLRVRRSVFFGGIGIALVSISIPWLLNRYIPLSVYSDWETFRLLFAITMPLRLFATYGIPFAIIGGSLMVTKKYPDAKWTKPFIATGQLALTLYVVHLVIVSLLRALGIFWFPTEIVVILFCICAIIFSYFWRKRFERGPLEWAIRRITG